MKIVKKSKYRDPTPRSDCNAGKGSPYSEKMYHTSLEREKADDSGATTSGQRPVIGSGKNKPATRAENFGAKKAKPVPKQWLTFTHKLVLVLVRVRTVEPRRIKIILFSLSACIYF